MDQQSSKKRRGRPLKEPDEDRSATSVSSSLLLEMIGTEANFSNVEHEADKRNATSVAARRKLSPNFERG
jgi:hypothetical protein